MVVAVLALMAGTGSIVAGTQFQSISKAALRWVTPSQSGSPAPTASPSPPPPPPLLQPGPVTIDSPGFWSWALLNTRTGELAGAQNRSATSTTASMIKAWIVADYLRLGATAGRTPSQARLGELSLVIRDSHNEIAERTFQQVGAQESIKRLISICKLTETKPYRSWWSNTAISAQDTARMAACIGDGRAAGPKWTTWLLNEMRLVRAPGNFGIIQALPPNIAKNTAIKNGWLLRDEDGMWHISCLAIGDGWTLGVLARYPGRLGFEHGTNICKSIAAQLLHPEAAG
jgi:hypothetical protein